MLSDPSSHSTPSYFIMPYLFPMLAAVQTKLLSPGNGEYETTISSEEISSANGFPKMSIQVPSELTEIFANSDENDGVVRAVSYLYYNVEGLFPSDLLEENE